MAIPEVRNRQPGMMMLVSLAMSVAFLYSLAAMFVNLQEGFFWELITLIDIMLLGDWIGMRSLRQASAALNELAKLMPDSAEYIMPDGSIHTMPVASFKTNHLVLVRPGASIPADGIVEEGESDVNSMITGESQAVKKLPGSKVIAGTIKSKDGSKEAVAELHQVGLTVAMITGDNQKTAEAIAKQVGIDQVLAEILPEGTQAKSKNSKSRIPKLEFRISLQWSAMALTTGPLSPRQTSVLQLAQEPMLRKPPRP